MNEGYELVRRQPVARFFYSGSHSHPIRRVVAITEINNETITGYELRCGRTVREIEDAPIRSYRRDEIPCYGDYWRLRRLGRPLNQSTLVRESISALQTNGI